MRATNIRHPKERIAKCSLRPLRGRAELTFIKARPDFRFDGSGFTQLAVDAPVLGRGDASRPLLLLDSTWRLLPQIEACVIGKPERRGLPGTVVSAYPRFSKIAADPAAGLASVEALFTASVLLGEADLSLLDGYHWGNLFVENLRRAGLMP